MTSRSGSTATIQHGGPASLPNNSQFKCYDGMHNWNQVQPAPYDGMYQFPSVTASIRQPENRPEQTARPAYANPDTTDPDRSGTPMLPAGKYVVEVVVPPGYELVKEEDKNILLGDNYIAPVTQQFAGLGNIFIMPDQAAVNASYNPAIQPDKLRTRPRTWARCRATRATPAASRRSGRAWRQARIVPDYISLFPRRRRCAVRRRDPPSVRPQGSDAARIRRRCWRSSTSSPRLTSPPTSPALSRTISRRSSIPSRRSSVRSSRRANLPVSIRDWTGNEISRVYSDQWGSTMA